MSRLTKRVEALTSALRPQTCPRCEGDQGFVLEFRDVDDSLMETKDRRCLACGSPNAVHIIVRYTEVKAPYWET